MTSPVFNAQFLQLDFRVLDHPEFGVFMKTTAFAVYLQLRRYIWRSHKPHPVSRVSELRREGKLVCAVERSFLARKLGIREEAHISRHITSLSELGAIQVVRTGRQNVYVLGSWEDRSLAQDGSYLIEIFFLDQLFGADRRPQIQVESQSAGQVSETDTSQVSPIDTSAAQVSASDTAPVSPPTTSAMSRTTPKKYREKSIENNDGQKLSLLKGFRFSAQQLRQIAETYSPERISEVVSAFRQSGEEKIDNPAGWILAALRDGYEFDSTGKRLQAKRKRIGQREQEAFLRQAAEEVERRGTAARVEAWIAAHPAEFRGLVEQERERWQGRAVGSSDAYLRSQARLRVKELLDSGVEDSPRQQPAAFTVRRLRLEGLAGGEGTAEPEQMPRLRATPPVMAPELAA